MRRMKTAIPVVLLALATLAGCEDASDALRPGDPADPHEASLDAGVGGGGQGGAGGGGGWGGAGGEGGGWGAPDAGAWGAESDAAPTPGNTNVNLGGAQDIGYFRRLLADGIVPQSDDIDAAGFFAEHHTPLPTPDCGEQVCLQAMLGVMANLINGNNCTLLQLGLNSPLVADPRNRPPLSLTVVVDVSGSMSADGKLEFVREGLGQMVNELNDDDRIALVKYSSDATLLQPMIDIRGNRNDLHGLIDRLVPEGATNIHDGLDFGYREAFRNYDSGRQNRLILLSDGVATTGITEDEPILDLSRRYNREGVGLTTVGLGTDFNLPLMRGLAEQGDGNFYFVEHAAAVEEVFTEELSYFTVPVAFDVELRMAPGSDYRVVRAYGSRLWESTPDGGGAVVVPSVFLAHRVSHGDVGEGGTRRGGGSALLVELMPEPSPQREPGEARVAVVDLRFREPGTDVIVQQQVRVTYPDEPDVLRLEGFFDNAIVEKSFVMLNIYVGITVALDRFHFERDGSGAVGMLRALIAAVADYEDSANNGDGDVDMQLDIDLLEVLVEVMIANGAHDPDLPPEEDPWPAD